MALSDVANISISTTPAGPTQQGFGVPMVLGACKNALAAFGSTIIRYYNQGTFSTAMTADGFLTTDPEYLAVQAIFSQKAPAPPPKVAVGRRTRLPTQKFVFTILTSGVVKNYTVTVNGVAKTYTNLIGDSTTQIATGLAAAIGTPTGFGAAVASTNTVTLTASATGNWGRFAVTSPNVDIDCQCTHVDAGIVADMTDIETQDSTWYGVISVFNSQTEVPLLAAHCEAKNLLYLAGTQDSTTLGAGTSDVASTVKASNYTHTSVWYHADNGVFIDAAMAGARLPITPGGENWAFTPVVGVPATALTATQQTNLQGKLCNFVYLTAGLTYSWKGWAASGDWVDVVRGKDWTIARLQTRILTLQSLLASQGKRISFTDSGISLLESELRAQYSEGVAAGFIAAAPAATYIIPKAAAASSADRTARALNGMSFQWPLAGAIDSANINGVLS